MCLIHFLRHAMVYVLIHLSRSANMMLVQYDCWMKTELCQRTIMFEYLGHKFVHYFWTLLVLTINAQRVTSKCLIYRRSK